MSRQAFHHGSLRAALLQLAAKELELHGYEALSLRGLAESLGVSSAAPYRHFENKNALLLALAQIGLERLRLLYEKALTLEASSAARLSCACQAYLDFARDNPELFRLIFVGNADWHAGPADKFEGQYSAFQIFERLVADHKTARTEKEALVASLVVWSIIHGFAVLRMNDRFARLFDISVVEATQAAIIAQACFLQNQKSA